MTDFRIENIGDERHGYSSGIGALVRSFHVVFVFLSIFIAAIIIWYIVFWGYFTVNPQEAVIVTRFGKITAVYTDNWHWTLPYPVSRIIRIPVSRQTVTTKSFKAFEEGRIPGAPEGNAEEPSERPLVPGQDGYLLTGDANIIHTEWEMVYEISDPMKYYTKCFCPFDPKKDDELLNNPMTGKLIGRRGPRTLLVSVLENAVLKATATRKVEQPLYEKVSDYVDAVENETRRIIDGMDIGVTLKSMVLKSITPPGGTVRAFREVIMAEEESSSEKQRAMEYAIKTEKETETDSSRIKIEAEVYKIRTVAEIESENIYFGKILKEYRRNPESVLIPLYSETIGNLLDAIKDKYIIPNVSDKDKQELRIMLNPEPRYQQPEPEESK